jgi:SOS-response transcriptional repressor LexA
VRSTRIKAVWLKPMTRTFWVLPSKVPKSGDQIKDGDVAIISPKPDVENGRIAAVIVEGIFPEATLKIVRKKRNGLKLHSANQAWRFAAEPTGRRGEPVQTFILPDNPDRPHPPEIPKGHWG